MDNVRCSRPSSEQKLNEVGQQGEPSSDIIARYLEHLASQYIDALNTRLFSANAALYQQTLDPAFKAIPGPPAAPVAVKLEDYLLRMATVIDEFPNTQMVVLDHDTNVDTRQREAQVFVNYEVTKAPPGVVKRALCIFRFRRRPEAGQSIEEQWKCYTLQVLDGMEAAGA